MLDRQVLNRDDNEIYNKYRDCQAEILEAILGNLIGNIVARTMKCLREPQADNFDLLFLSKVKIL